jgi:transcriptional regulator with XRE-family HTH domain
MAEKKKEPTYEDLSKIYTDEEIVESFVLRSTLSEDEKKEAHKEFLKFRMDRLKNMSESDIILSNLMRMKIQIQNYIEQNEYNPRFDFSNQLKEYLSITKRTQKDFSEEIDIHPAQLNRIIRGKENPNVDLLYRLEKHSEGLLKAKSLYRLHTMKLESEMVNDEESRLAQYDRVKQTISLAKAS